MHVRLHLHMYTHMYKYKYIYTFIYAYTHTYIGISHYLSNPIGASRIVMHACLVAKSWTIGRAVEQAGGQSVGDSGNLGAGVACF